MLIGTVRTIDVATLRRWLVEGKPITILDVRSAAERAEWAIPGSLHFDAYDALKQGGPHALDALTLPSDQPVVTVCGAGRTSLIAAEQLQARGLEVYSLEGGMRAWSLAWNTAPVRLLTSNAQVLQVRRIGKGCLSYLVGAGAEAAVIDAALDPAVYVTLAREQGWRIVAVLDTHLHADHLSRARPLAELTDATLYLPAQARAQFPFTPLGDGDALTLGPTRITALHTPGHTAESTCYLLDDTALFTGDTLFIGAVGRPDLHAADTHAATARAQALYTSLQRLLRLPPATLVLPAHTSAPSPFDGRPVAATLAEVLACTPLLQADEAAFITTTLARIPPTPPNYERIVALNETGELVADPTELEAGANRCAIA
jgi:glyoxylase-like metal-dependent hydrolase (beta-lactamase superfamily II)/rhodanese-related sulfurtransferase